MSETDAELPDEVLEAAWRAMGPVTMTGTGNMEEADARAVVTAHNAQGEAERRVRHIDDWHENVGPVLWWTNPPTEAPYAGSPLDTGRPIEVIVDGHRFVATVGGWPGYHEWWTPLPAADEIIRELEGGR